MTEASCVLQGARGYIYEQIEGYISSADKFNTLVLHHYYLEKRKINSLGNNCIIPPPKCVNNHVKRTTVLNM